MGNLVATGSFINELRIGELLEAKKPERAAVLDILAKAREAKGLSLEEVAQLTLVDDPQLLEELFRTAREVKETIYGNRIVLFAPLYISNLCGNDCSYCAFRTSNKELVRKALTMDEIKAEVHYLVEHGHKRLLVVAGEAYDSGHSLKYIYDAIEACYSVKTERGEIRRINANIAPLSVEDFRDLKATGIGTYQCFQETYHRATYKKVHQRGRKALYDWRICAMHRAMEAGIDDVGIGPLFGLYDWRFELLATLMHVRSLEECYGVGPHTISFPRIEPALGSDVAMNPPYKVSDEDFLKIIAITRLAVPYTGMILSTRESPEFRDKCIALGISQISAGSRVDPGGYGEAEDKKFAASQFQVGDYRTIDEVICSLAKGGYIPSFCTACYRLGRTGCDFMDLAKPGEIKNHCFPNAVATFQEYLEDFASPETKAVGEQVIAKVTESLSGLAQERCRKFSERVKNGERDVIC